jgi:hypothetical protein
VWVVGATRGHEARGEELLIQAHTARQQPLGEEAKHWDDVIVSARLSMRMHERDVGE